MLTQPLSSCVALGITWRSDLFVSTFVFWAPKWKYRLMKVFTVLGYCDKSTGPYINVRCYYKQENWSGEELRDLCKGPQLDGSGIQSPHSSPRHHILQVNSNVVHTDPFCLHSIHPPSSGNYNFMFPLQSHPTPTLSPCVSALFLELEGMSLNPSLGNQSHPDHKVCSGRGIGFHVNEIPSRTFGRIGREKPLFNTSDYQDVSSELLMAILRLRE